MEENHSSRSAKGNKYMRRVLTEAAQAAVKAKGSHFQAVFRRLLPRLGYKQALWAIAHRLCRLVWKILHDGVRYVEQGAYRDPKPENSALRPWHEPCANSATTSTHAQGANYCTSVTQRVMTERREALLASTSPFAETAPWGSLFAAISLRRVL